MSEPPFTPLGAIHMHEHLPLPPPCFGKADASCGIAITKDKSATNFMLFRINMIIPPHNQLTFVWSLRVRFKWLAALRNGANDAGCVVCVR
jgi:hypothetical protein